MLALERLTKQGHRMCILPQCLIELWNVCTRPLASNGFGFTVEVTRDRIDEVESTFHLLPDPPEVYWEWRRLVEAHRVMGKQVHDARLVAAMRMLGIRHILTYNVQDFVRYPDLIIVHPSEVR